MAHTPQCVRSDSDGEGLKNQNWVIKETVQNDAAN